MLGRLNSCQRLVLAVLATPEREDAIGCRQDGLTLPPVVMNCRLSGRAVAFVGLAVGFASATSRAQTASRTVLSGAALIDDVRVLRRALESLHPGLYRYATPPQLDRRIAALEAHLRTGATLVEAYLAIAEFTGALGCGHTFPNPANQSRTVSAAVFQSTPRVPFYFRWLDGRIVVTEDVSAEHVFPPGTEIVAINDVPTTTILERLLPYTRTDGGNHAKRVANLAVHATERFEAFDIYFPLVFRPPPGDWTFRARSPGGVRRTVRAAPVDLAQRMVVYDSLRRVARDTTSPPWTLTIDDGIATLRMPSWVTFNDSWDWKGFVRRAFEEIDARRARTLVIDIRGNEGGTSVGDEILTHLIDREIVPNQFRRYTRYRAIPSDLRPYLDTWDRSFDDWGAAAHPSAAPAGAGTTGFYRLTRYDSDTAGGTIEPASPRFRGRVFVLVGADNSSATFEFALAVRQNKLGTLVGQPTGGNQRGINGGAFYFLRLPHSGIEVDLPLIGYFAQTLLPDAGLDPDVLVRVSAADIAARRDPEVEAVRRLVRGEEARADAARGGGPRHH